MNSLYKKILKEIKKFDSIAIARHIGPDPDALGSQFALKDLILNTYPNKKVYAIGSPASKFKFMGQLDKTDDISYKDTLLIVLDTPDIKRIDATDVNLFKKIIKIDHHPLIDNYANIEVIDETSCSTAQLILEFALENKLELTEDIAKNIYLGIIGDTDRFLHDYTTLKTFKLVSILLEKTNLDFISLYEKLYERPYSEIKFEGYIYENITITENGLAYIKITDDLLKKYNVDSSTPGNMINDLKYVNEITIWIFFTEDIKNNIIKANIRSKGPIINQIASNFNGGGHKYASGAKLKDWETVDKMIETYDNYVKEYKENNIA